MSPISAATFGRWDYLARVSQQDLEGKGVLEAAVKGNRPEVPRRLLALGLVPDERTPVGPIAEQNWSSGGPLFQAVGVQLATSLLDGGARLDVRDDLLESTPLGWTCRWGRVEMVKLFLARGADPVEADAEAWATPRAGAEKMQRPEIVELLRCAKEGR